VKNYQSLFSDKELNINKNIFPFLEIKHN